MAPLSLQTSGVQHLTWLVSHLPPPPHPHGLDCRSCGFKSLICSTPFPRVFIYTGKRNAFFLFFTLLSCSIRSHQDEPGRMFSHFSGNWFCSGLFCFGFFFFLLLLLNAHESTDEHFHGSEFSSSCLFFRGVGKTKKQQIMSWSIFYAGLKS